MARPRATSREHIDAVALDLFLRQGFASVTGDELARACGISRPTLFRYVAQTANIVLDQVASFGDLTVQRLQGLPGGPWESMGTALVEAYGQLDGDSLRGKAFEVLRREPDLRARSGLMARAWRAGLAAELRTRGLDDPVASEALAGAAIGIITAAFAHQWTAAELERALGCIVPRG